MPSHFEPVASKAELSCVVEAVSHASPLPTTSLLRSSLRSSLFSGELRRAAVGNWEREGSGGGVSGIGDSAPVGGQDSGSSGGPTVPWPL